MKVKKRGGGITETDTLTYTQLTTDILHRYNSPGELNGFAEG